MDIAAHIHLADGNSARDKDSDGVHNSQSLFCFNLGRTYGDELRATGRLEMALQDLLAGSSFNMAEFGREYDQGVFDGLDSQATRRQQMALDIKGALS